MSRVAAIVLLLCATQAHADSGDALSHAFEGAFQIANAYDYAQTINTARRPDCYRENDPFTRRIIGVHPSSGAVGAMWAAQAGAHLLVTRWLDREVDATDQSGWKAARWIWHGLTLGNAVMNVMRNNEIGLRPFGDGSNCGR